MSTIKNSPRKNSTRKTNRIPSGETPDSISPKKSKTPSPNKNKTRKAMNDAITILANMDYRENPEIFDLLNTNKQYKSQINRINELQLKIQEYQTEISEFGELMDKNDEKMDELREKLYDDEDESTPSQKSKIAKEMKSIKSLKEDYSKNIDLREARIEETEFLIKIWQSTKINDNEKKQLEKEYIKEYRKFDKNFKAVQNKIDNLRNQTSKKTNPIIKRDTYNELSEQQRKLNDDFYRGYNTEIQNIIN
jgi:hypothetical protein